MERILKNLRPNYPILILIVFLFLLCSTIVVCTLLIVFGSFFFSNSSAISDFVNRSSPATITVNGSGKVFGTPDLANITISFSELGNSSEQAISKLNQKVSKAKEIILSSGVGDSDVKTSQFEIYPEYDYSTNQRKILGHRASMTLSVKVKGLDSTAKKVSELIDKLVVIPEINFGGVTFDIEDKENLFNQARDLAFKEAEKKASQLASLGKVKLLKPLSIRDSQGESNYPVVPFKYDSSMPLRTFDTFQTSFSSGQLSVEVNVEVVWVISYND